MKTEGVGETENVKERETERDRDRQTGRQSGNESMGNNTETHLSCNSLHFAKDMQTYATDDYNKCHFSRWNYRNNRPGQHNEWRYMIHERPALFLFSHERNSMETQKRLEMDAVFS